MKHLFVVLVSCCIAITAAGADMVRVSEVIDGKTIVVSRGARSERVTLSGVIIPPNDADAAAAYLRRLILHQWVLIERDDRSADGHIYVYRSPDALFVNGEIARRAYAHPGVPMVYLGTIDPGPRVERSGASPNASGTASRRASTPKRSTARPRRPPVARK
ncbi:MAG TPA: hypothetical protein VFL80_09830 [Thermoanaerobaculia bacterium]|nr:hypothetical protein [Thermoanaerobaculia bacterium]